MTNKDILKTALMQSAVDLNCTPEDFLKYENRVVPSKSDPGARKYLELPFICNIVYYGCGVVASCRNEYSELVQNYIDSFPPEHLFETPNMHILDDSFSKMGARVCFMAEYFLPDVEVIKPLTCPYELRTLYKSDIAGLYKPEWSNALCEKRSELDVLGVGAYDNGTLIGLAACSADCENMWQIGIDVLQKYRRQGVASALTSNLALKILELGKVPFYCAAWSNIGSVRNAIRAGFRPAWVELTVKSAEYTNSMNKN